jgi:hypothetical protein
MGDDDESTVTTITAYRKIISENIDKHQGRVVDRRWTPKAGQPEGVDKL